MNKTKDLHKKRKDAIEEVRAILSTCKKGFNEITVDSTSVSSGASDFEPALNVEEKGGKVRIVELNGFSNHNRATRRLIKVLSSLFI